MSEATKAAPKVTCEICGRAFDFRQMLGVLLFPGMLVTCSLPDPEGSGVMEPGPCSAAAVQWFGPVARGRRARAYGGVIVPS